jgi:hypothetical protein
MEWLSTRQFIEIRSMCSALRRSCPAVRLCAVMTLIGVLCVRVAPIAQAQTLAITFVQANSSTPQSSQPIVSAPYTLSQTTGSLNVVVIGWRDSIAHVQSVSDSTGNTYTLAVGPTTQTGLATQSIYFAKNIQPSADAAKRRFWQSVLAHDEQRSDCDADECWRSGALGWRRRHHRR